MSRPKPQRRIRGGKKIIKRLNGNNKQSRMNSQLNVHQSPLQRETNQQDEYHRELADFMALRRSDTNQIPSDAAIPSQELMWIRDESSPQRLSNIPFTPRSNNMIRIDDEIEDGEIVETENSDVVNLLDETSEALNRSMKINFPTPTKNQLFYEDRGNAPFGKVPLYSTFGTEIQSLPEEKINSSNDDVICLDITQPSADDSVIFVSEEKPNTRSRALATKLATPDFLKSPATRVRKSKQKQRVAAWQKMKTKQFAARAALNNSEAVPSTSNACTKIQSVIPPETVKEVTRKENEVPQLEKRIILIDGSNFAMSYTENYGAKKTDKDFSVEGLKIGIEHFEKMGFKVKAVVPEWRVRREKSSNQALMLELRDQGKLTLTPSKSYDDRVILDFAVKLDAAVVSNDHYRDLLNEKPEYQEVVKRIIRFNWCFNQLIIPEDPHGRDGPKLNDILYKKPI